MDTLELASPRGVGALGALVLAGVIEAVGCGSLLSLTLSRCGLRDAGTAALAKALGNAAEAKRSTLAVLDVAHNGMGEEGAKALAAMVERSPTLQTLVIDSAIGREGSAALALAMKGRELRWA